ncbi:MAG: hypothetical protein BGO21_21250 [Dyadobacter sp. 50-39]|uniref:hypothetical protein n=1 Tax=Dyadobacter sp. 50-39 TaxID=1895756 RepID=UPI000960B5A6|nr:hypothetical protein [Dyadobacter sp. 50-39]OJV19223.1 MAG: hypothetical protein BGO21_21250 [Dyadobacter sp. 50-39]
MINKIAQYINPRNPLFWIFVIAGWSLIYRIFTKQPALDAYKGRYADEEISDSARAAKRKADSTRIAEETEAAMKAEAELNRKFYASKAGKIYKKHPEWSREACQRLARKEVWIGMHLDMLKYLRGLPDAANESNYGNGSQWQWCWHDLSPSCFYDRDNDMVIDAYN